METRRTMASASRPSFMFCIISDEGSPLRRGGAEKGTARTKVDRTGIPGTYDVTLSYTSHQVLDAPDYTGSGITVTALNTPGDIRRQVDAAVVVNG